MFRTTTIFSMLSLASVGIVSAGQIQLGGANGLTNAYIASGCATVGPCVAGSIAAGTEGSYAGTLFSGANISTQPPSGTITDTLNNVTFSTINDGVGNNVWVLPNNASNLAAATMTIPVGVLGVTDVYTMINAMFGPSGPGRDVTLFFNFGTTSNATTTDQVEVKLNNSTNSTTASGQIRNAIDCAPVTGACGGVSPAASGPTAASTLSSTLPAGTTAGLTVTTNNVFTATYTTATGSFAGSTGAVNLDDQGFLFNNVSLASLGVGDTNLNTYLVSIQVREAGVTTSDLGLSAITLDTVPEPSTVVLFLAGFGAIALGRYRRKA